MNQSLDSIFQKQLDTMQRIELFLDIYKCKQFVVPDLQKLKEDACKAAEKLQCTKEYLETDRKDVCLQFTEIMKKMRRNELLMLHLLEVGPHNKTEENFKTDQSDTPKSRPLGELQNENSSKMYLTDYSKSPFAARKSKDIHFYDFDAEITEQDFEAIPKYLKGRMQLAELAQFLKNDVIKCFEEKYTLMYKHRKVITNQHDLTAWKEYNNMQANFPDHKFITQDDLSRKSGKALDKKSSSKLQMLRHLHILQEVRSEGTVYFLWIYRN